MTVFRVKWLFFGLVFTGAPPVLNLDFKFINSLFLLTIISLNDGSGKVQYYFVTIRLQNRQRF